MLSPRKPARMPMRNVRGVPATMTASKSRPWLSVPNGYCHDGGFWVSTESGSAFVTSTKNGPMAQNRSNTSNRTIPTPRLGFRRMYRQIPVSKASSPPIGYPRIDQRIDEVDNECCKRDRHDDGKDNTLNQK